MLEFLVHLAVHLFLRSQRRLTPAELILHADHARRRGDLDAADVALDAALGANPTHEEQNEIYAARADVYVRRGDPELAIHAYATLARRLMLAGKATEAREAERQARGLEETARFMRKVAKSTR